MANEAVPIEVYGTPVIRTCANATNISKGTLLKLADPNTVSASGTGGEAFGGIAAADKQANDGSTTIGAWMSGVWDLTNAALGTIATGASVKLSGANLISTAVVADTLTGTILGTAEEDAGTSEVIRVRLIGI